MTRARRNKIQALLAERPGMTQREIAEVIEGSTHKEVVRIGADLRAVAESGQCRPAHWYPPGTAPSGQASRSEELARLIAKHVETLRWESTTALVQRFAGDGKVKRSRVRAAIKRAERQGMIVVDRRYEQHRIYPGGTKLPKKLPSSRKDHSKLAPPKPEDRLFDHEIRPVEPDNDDAGYHEWLWSRHVDPMLPRDLPREVRQVLDEHRWEVRPRYSPVSGELRAYHEWLSKDAEDEPPALRYSELTVDERKAVLDSYHNRPSSGHTMSIADVARQHGVERYTVQQIVNRGRAGLADSPHDRALKMTEEKEREAQRMYRAGETYDAIAETLGVSSATARRACKTPRWLEPVGSRKPAYVDEIRRLYAAGGWTHRSLGEKFGVSYSQVRRIVNCLAWRG